MVISSSLPLQEPFQPLSPSPSSVNYTTNKRSYRDSYDEASSSSSGNDQFLSKLLSFDGKDLISFGEVANLQMDDDESFISSNSSSKRARTNPDVESGGSSRRVWVKDRSNAWWEQVSRPDFPEQGFKDAFRMSRATFDMVCRELEPVITKKDTVLRLAVPVPQRVAVCIWRLATSEALREVSRRFGLGISTCHKLILEVCTAIKTVLMPKFLHWPDEPRMGSIKREFEGLSGIPNVGGLVYTTHVPIIAPKVSVSAYYNKKHTERNQKTSYSVTVQGVVDHRGIFTDVCIGWPGSMTDGQVLEKSALFERARNGGGSLKEVWLVGGSSFPLLDWLLVPYQRQQLTWAQHAYNERIEDVSKVVREAFVRLKSRWSCLQKRTEMKLEDLPVVLGACCVLHNICEARGEGLSDELRFDVFDDVAVAEINPATSVDALNRRDEIAHKLLHHSFE